jgi:SAM-dependent methyltransferase
VRLNDRELVRREYADESRFAVRAAAWQTSCGPDPRELAFEAVAEVEPGRVLEVGSGRGELAARIAGELGAEVVAVDQSPRMVEPARERGVDARVGDVQARAYVAASATRALLADELPRFDGPLEASRRVAVLVASKRAA